MKATMKWTVTLEHMQAHDIDLYTGLMAEFRAGVSLEDSLDDIVYIWKSDLMRKKGSECKARVLAIMLAAYEGFTKGEVRDSANNRET